MERGEESEMDSMILGYEGNQVLVSEESKKHRVSYE